MLLSSQFSSEFLIGYLPPTPKYSTPLSQMLVSSLQNSDLYKMVFVRARRVRVRFMVRVRVRVRVEV